MPRPRVGRESRREKGPSTSRWRPSIPVCAREDRAARSVGPPPAIRIAPHVHAGKLGSVRPASQRNDGRRKGTFRAGRAGNCGFLPSPAGRGASPSAEVKRPWGAAARRFSLTVSGGYLRLGGRSQVSRDRVSTRSRMKREVGARCGRIEQSRHCPRNGRRATRIRRRARESGDRPDPRWSLRYGKVMRATSRQGLLLLAAIL